MCSRVVCAPSTGKQCFICEPFGLVSFTSETHYVVVQWWNGSVWPDAACTEGCFSLHALRLLTNQRVMR